MQIGRFRVVGNRRANGRDAVGGGNAGGHAVRRFDGYSKTGAERAGVVFHHHRQVELFTAFFGQAQADNAAAVTDGQRHLFNGHGFGGENHVAFVFTVLVIEHHHAAPFAQCGDRVFHAFKSGAKSRKKRLIHGKETSLIIWITRIRAVLGVPASGKQNNVSGRKPRQIVTLSHPDFNRRPRNYTGSADLQKQPEALAGFQFILRLRLRAEA
ncbi:hypothetical protein BN131_1797 [Cronobacter malonaticus 681]|nr:hypothetical protein BN131_1797 [Cronobacter malonaticus 681]